MRKILLCGYMGAGKTVVGRRLAQLTGFAFHDLDDCIEEDTAMRIGELFAVKGEIWFRKKEREVLTALLASDKNEIIALGGGTPAYGNNHLLFEQPNVKAFYLQASIGELAARLSQQRSHRPLIANIPEPELEEFIGKHLFERQLFYRHHTQIIQVDGKSPDEIGSEILTYLS